MTLSQEILVLDFGDEKQSEFFKSDASIDFNEAGEIVQTKLPFGMSDVKVFMTFELNLFPLNMILISR